MLCLAVLAELRLVQTDGHATTAWAYTALA